MTKNSPTVNHYTYPLVPLLLTAENEKDFRIRYEALEKILGSIADARTLAIELAQENTCNSHRGVALLNVNTRQIDLAFENHLNTVETRPVVFMFTGIGNQYLDMSRGLYETASVFRACFDYCCEFLEPIANKDLKEVVFSQTAATNGFAAINDSQDRFDFKKMLNKSRNQLLEKRLLDKTEYLHPLMFVVEYSLAQQLIHWGVKPKVLIGHSVGEYVAATISGALSVQDALTLITRRAQLIEELPPGAMSTVLAGKDEIDVLLKEHHRLFLATENSPISCTISGREEDISKLEEELEKRDIVFFRLPTDRAFHSLLLAPIETEFKKVFDRSKVNPLEIPFVSNLTGDWMTDEQVADSNTWFLHTCKTVQFSEGIKKLLDIKDCVLIEIGPGQTLTGFAFQHKYKDKNPNAMILSVLKNENDNLPDNIFLLNALCKLWVNGVAVDWSKVLDFPE